MPIKEGEYSALWAAVMSWAVGLGETDITTQPGVWHRRTKQIGSFGPLDVRINPHKEEIESIPQFYVRISMDDYFPGLIALIGPNEGIVMNSHQDGENEDGLINHFREQTPEACRAA